MPFPRPLAVYAHGSGRVHVLARVDQATSDDGASKRAARPHGHRGAVCESSPAGTVDRKHVDVGPGHSPSTGVRCAQRSPLAHLDASPAQAQRPGGPLLSSGRRDGTVPQADLPPPESTYPNGHHRRDLQSIAPQDPAASDSGSPRAHRPGGDLLAGLGDRSPAAYGQNLEPARPAVASRRVSMGLRAKRSADPQAPPPKAHRHRACPPRAWRSNQPMSDEQVPTLANSPPLDLEAPPRTQQLEPAGVAAAPGGVRASRAERLGLEITGVWPVKEEVEVLALDDGDIEHRTDPGSRRGRYAEERHHSRTP
jgi:hypothetical protein